MKRLIALTLALCMLLTGCSAAESLFRALRGDRGTFSRIVQHIRNYVYLPRCPDPQRGFRRSPISGRAGRGCGCAGQGFGSGLRCLR